MATRSSISDDFDVCARRNGGHPRSVEANRRIGPHKVSDRERIRIQIDSAGFSGLSLNELRLWDEKRGCWKQCHQLSPRVTELRIAGLIFDSHRQRSHSTVYVSRACWVTPGSVTPGSAPEAHPDQPTTLFDLAPAEPRHQDEG